MRTVTWICATLFVVVGASISRADGASLYEQSLADELTALLAGGRKDDLSARQQKACAQVVPFFDKFRQFATAEKQAAALTQLLQKLERIARGNELMTGPLARTAVLLIDRAARDALGLKKSLGDEAGTVSARRRERALSRLEEILGGLRNGLALLLPAVNKARRGAPPLRQALRHLKRAHRVTKRVAAAVGQEPRAPCGSCRPLGAGESATLTFEVGSAAYTIEAAHVDLSLTPEGVKATIEVIGDGVTVLDSLEVTIIVPPGGFAPQVVVSGDYGPEDGRTAITKGFDTSTSPIFVEASLTIEPRGPGGPTLTIDLRLGEP